MSLSDRADFIMYWAKMHLPHGEYDRMVHILHSWKNDVLTINVAKYMIRQIVSVDRVLLGDVKRFFELCGEDVRDW